MTSGRLRKQKKQQNSLWCSLQMKNICLTKYWQTTDSTGQLKSIMTVIVCLTGDCQQHYIIPQSNHGLLAPTYKRNVDNVSEMITNSVEHQFVVNPQNNET